MLRLFFHSFSTPVEISWWCISRSTGAVLLGAHLKNEGLQGMNSWDKILQHMERRVNPHSFSTWFRPTRQEGAENGKLVVRVPSRVFRKRLTETYGELLQAVLEEVGMNDTHLEFLCTENDALPSGTSAKQTRLDFDSVDHQLNPRYLFETFVVGASNQFAHAAAQAVAEQPSKAYNPLFLYGGVGMGKTHLMQAVGHLIKKRTQEEFFHTFNALYDLQRQIVVSSDCPPKEISAIEERLRSRFEWGLIADIQPPDLETKIAILQKKAETERVMIPDDVAEYIARAIKSNVRELEGALTRLVAYSSLTGSVLNLATAQQVLRNIIATQEKRVTIDLIQKKVGRQFGGKHHTTVLHSINKIDALRRSDKDLNRTINKLMDSFS